MSSMEDPLVQEAQVAQTQENTALWLATSNFQMDFLCDATVLDLTWLPLNKIKKDSCPKRGLLVWCKK